MPLINDSKKKALEVADELDILGQENNKKAAKWVIEKGEKKRKEEVKQEQTAQEILADATRKKKVYVLRFAEQFYEEMQKYQEDLPKDCAWYIKPTDEGIEMKLVVKEKTYFRATKVTGEPFFDRNAMYRFITQALILATDRAEENTIWTPPKTIKQ